MKKLNFSYHNALDFVQEHEVNYLTEQVKLAHDQLHSKQGAGSDYLGWIDWPNSYDQEEYQRLKVASQRIQDNSEVLLVIGIGGSYLGAKAAIDLLTHSFYNVLPKNKRQTPQIFYVGHHLSGSYIQELMEVIDGKDISINVISKSGTTTEPAIAFRIFRSYLEDKYGEEEAARRIYATTDQAKGALRSLAEEKGYETFVIPDDIGGRYSVLTPVGLLPIAVAGIDTDAMLAGAQAATNWYAMPDLASNESYQYAALRNILYQKGKTIEILVNYEPQLQYFAEWWKQLFGESEGKDQKGIFPAAVNFSTDLHSMGQYIQEGLRNIFETVLVIEKSSKDLAIEKEFENLDGLNYLVDQSLSQVNYKAFQGTLLAHIDGGVPNLVLTIPERSAFYFGALVYFFEKACGLSGYLLGVNPFEQPGVEAYKKNMFALLGKPGFEQQRAALEKRLKNKG